MEKRVIPFSPPDISELEINEVAEAMRSGWITTGPRTKELEKRLAEYCHTSKVVCLNSATAAEELTMSTVWKAYENRSGADIVDRPKALGDLRGVSYIYPIFYRFGLIEVPEKVKEKMQKGQSHA